MLHTFCDSYVLKMLRSVTLTLCNVYVLWLFTLCDIVRCVTLTFCNTYVLWLLRCVQLRLETVTFCDVNVVWCYVLSQYPYHTLLLSHSSSHAMHFRSKRIFLCYSIFLLGKAASKIYIEKILGNMGGSRPHHQNIEETGKNRSYQSQNIVQLEIKLKNKTFTQKYL